MNEGIALFGNGAKQDLLWSVAISAGKEQPDTVQSQRETILFGVPPPPPTHTLPLQAEVRRDGKRRG